MTLVDQFPRPQKRGSRRNVARPPVKPRRGVLLLVVLSLLVLFLLAGLSFVIVAGQYRRGTIAVSKIERTQTAPQKLLDNAIQQVLNPPDAQVNPATGFSNSVTSALSGHGLLEDLYGREGFAGVVSSVVPGSGQFVRMTATVTSSFWQPKPPSFYAGCVLTMTSGTLSGKSTRIAEYTWDPSNPTNVMIVIESPNGKRPLPTERFVVNGRPLNGTGQGFMPTTGNLDLSQDYTGDGIGDAPCSLLPRLATSRFDGNNDGDGLINTPDTFGYVGGADESYDSPDYQNMLLGWMASDTGLVGGGEKIIPSLHRPALINYWNSTAPGGLGPANIQLLRDVCLRPNIFDHPQFNGSNPYLDVSVGPVAFMRRLVQGTDDINGDGIVDPISTWDVDNDGDGLTDSIWVDLGFPVETDASGRTYKPLFAILCLDLDGRVNLNAAGIWDDFVPDTTGLLQSTAGQAFGSGGLPYGQGIGPPEIDPSFILGSDTNTVLLGRYAGSFSSSPPETLPGVPATSDQLLYSFFHQVEPVDPLLPLIPPGLYSSPFDVLARASVAVDHNGQPISTRYWGTPSLGTVSEVKDNPYELNLVEPNASDAIYRISELEPLLRPFDYDHDRTISRLSSLAAFSFPLDNNALRRMRSVTVSSFEIPTANIQLSHEDRVSPPLTPPSDPLMNQVLVDLYSGRSPSLADIYALQLLRIDPTQSAVQVTDQLRVLMPFEFFFGERMNLNRLFGDGFDNNSNSVVDEPDEVNLLSLDHYVNDDPLTTATFAAGNVVQAPIRQLYARHLFTLLTFLANKNVPLAASGFGAPRYDAERMLAQWAINVVDFLDPDSIMTPFEVDLNPLDGWDVDGDIVSTDESATGVPRIVIWGVERPELLITETVAWHDRRSQDRDDESVDGQGNPIPQPGKIGSGNPPDTDNDQFALPVGTFFVELFNPLSTGYALPAAEVHDVAGNLHLNRTVTANGNTSPVWRLVVTPQFSVDPDDDPSFLPTEKRYIYFVDEATYNNPTFEPKASSATEKDYFSSITAAGVGIYVQPGQYAVVGSSGPGIPMAGGPIRWISNVGFLKNEQFSSTSSLPSISYNMVRQVELRPGDATDHQVKINNNGYISGGIANPMYTPLESDIRQNVAIAINRGRLGSAAVNSTESLNVSTPIGGYDLTRGTTVVATQRYGDRTGGMNGESENELVLTQVLDHPLDMGQDGLMDRFGIHANVTDPFHGVIPNYRTVFLQRLANPLLPHNALTNPYRTVDKAIVDLAVFEGFDRNTTPIPFYAKQRGDSVKFRNLTATPPLPIRNLWTREPDTMPTNVVYQNSVVDPLSLSSQHYFNLALQSSLGYTNDAFRPFYDSTTVPTAPVNYLGAPDTTSDPSRRQTYPWLAWNNRPFANVLELLNVPTGNSATVFESFNIVPTIPPVIIGAFADAPHGLNYLLPFLAERAGGTPVTPYDPTLDPGLNRLFDYVEVLPRFAGTQRWFNPNNISADIANTPQALREPNNRLSQFRDPGKINLNTIADVEVWKALVASAGLPIAEMEMYWNEIDLNRRGGTPGVNLNNLTLAPTVPSQFPNPYRSAAAADLAPIPAMRTSGRDATLLRVQEIYDTGYPLYAAQPPHRDRARNPQFHFENVQKLSSMTTTHSNVYAVWITVGYFEAKPNSTLPGGIELGKEIGADTGEIERHRAFYIIDRSIPVAYEPGKQHNAKDTVVLERFIE